MRRRGNRIMGERPGRTAERARLVNRRGAALCDEDLRRGLRGLYRLRPMHRLPRLLLPALATFTTTLAAFAAEKTIGVGAPPIPGAEVIIDGSRAMLDEKWIYWEGPGFKSAMPIKWQIVADPGTSRGSARH